MWISQRLEGKIALEAQKILKNLQNNYQITDKLAIAIQALQDSPVFRLLKSLKLDRLAFRIWHPLQCQQCHIVFLFPPIASKVMELGEHKIEQRCVAG